MFEMHHIPHRISLKAKLLLEVEEYFLYFLLRKWDRAFIPPGGVELTAGVVLRCSKVTQIQCRKAPTIERLSWWAQTLSVDLMVRVSVWLTWRYGL